MEILYNNGRYGRSGELMFGYNLKKYIEKHDIEAIPESERHIEPRSLFFVWFASNLTIGDLVLGFLFSGFGLDLGAYLLAAFLGNILGGSMLALMSITGKVTAQPQMINSQRSFGMAGGRAMSVLQWFNTIGWLTFNTVIAAYAMAGLISSGSLYFVPILIVSAIIFMLVLFGQEILHRFERYMSIILGILFIYICLSFPSHWNTVTTSLSAGTFSFSNFGIVLALSFSYIMSWGPYAADYSRYVPAESRNSRVFLFTLVGAAVASFWVEVVGFFMGSATGISSSSATDPTAPITAFMGYYAPVGLMVMVLGGLSANALNLYSNSLSLRSAGIRASRVTITFVVMVIAFTLAVLGYSNFYTNYENFLYLLDYWITPWLGVMIADFFIVNRTWERSGFPALNSRGIVSYLVGIAVSIPFMNPGAIIPAQYFSLILGGVDISYFVSFSVALILYVVLSAWRPSIKSAPAS